MTRNPLLIGCQAVLAMVVVAHGTVPPLFGQTTQQPTLNHIVTASGFGGYAGVAAPGSWIEIYGTNLAGTTRQWAAGDFNGAAAPTTLDGVTVSVGGAAAFLSYVSPTQVNVQVPGTTATGAVPVVVSYQGRASAALQLTIQAQEPGLLAPASFQVSGKQYAVAIHAATGAYVSNGSIPNTTAAPATAGETLTFYGIGFGAVNPAVAAGTVAGGQATLVNSFTMTIGNSTAAVQYAGIAPGNVGLYQFNVVVPANLSAGDQLVQFSVGGAVNTQQTLYVTAGGASTQTTPGAPTNVSATAGNGSVSVAFGPPPPPAATGAPLTGYTATCTGGGQRFTGTANGSPIAITGLTNGTTYTCTVVANSSAGPGASSAAVTVVPTASGGTGGGGTGGTFTLTSSAGTNGGTLPASFTCDGFGSTLPLAWSGAPAGTQMYALLMSTTPAGGSTQYNWVLYNIPATAKSLAQDSFLVGTTGLGDVAPGLIYDPPCSQLSGPQSYTWTLYALSGAPVLAVPASQVTGAALAAAIGPVTLGSASISMSYTRVAATATGSSTNCVYIRNSTQIVTDGAASVNCDGTYAYVASIDSTTDQTMNGITSTNLQVPTPQNFQGANGWKIPLKPVLAASATQVPSGPIGVAINGLPIFNPCVQNGNCTATNGDTKAEGQLDICNGHAGRADDYHYHAAPVCMMAEQSTVYWNTHPVGWLLDGFAVFGYGNADGSTPNRDSCGGITISGAQIPAGYPYTYAYHVIDTFPYITDNCISGVPSPDLPNQGSKYKTLRQPPVTPFNDTNMTLTTAPDGYAVLQFTSANPFVTNETGSDKYNNPAGTYLIRYIQMTGSALATALAQPQNANKTACWNFQFRNAAGATTQPDVAYCR